MVSRLEAHEKVLNKPENRQIHARYYPVKKIDSIVNVSGAGDWYVPFIILKFICFWFFLN